MLVVLLIYSFTHAQTSYDIWKPVSFSKTIGTKKSFRKTTPTQYQLFSLDTKTLQKALQSSASTGISKKAPTLLLKFPTEKGILKSFSIQQANTLHPALAKKYPGINSYVGYGIEDPTSVVRFSVSQIGLHAMISSGLHGTIYIDPYTTDKKNYIAYAKNHLTNTENSFECMVKEQATAHVEKLAPRSTKNANDKQLRTFRLALACTGEYAQFHLSNQNISAGASVQQKKAAILAAMNTTMTRVNGIFEKDLALTMVLVPNNDEVIFLDARSDDYSNNDGGAMLGQNQRVCDNVIGSRNYDIGHVFSTGGGGVAYLNSPCTGSKAGGVTGGARPIGDPFDVDFVAHEMGHQYGGNHTQNNNCQRSRASVEPGSASTIMGYAGICSPNVQRNSDAYFHAISIQEMWTNISQGRSRCAELSDTGNTAPTANAGSNYTIPASTPFVLKGNATDVDNDALTYCWEQMDADPAPMPPEASSNKGPAFRSFAATVSPERYFPKLTTVIDGKTASTWEVIPSVSRTMNFRLIVRDNSPRGGATDSDDMTVTVAGNAGPFIVTTPNTNISWKSGTKQTVQWDVAGTTANGINAATVDILLSTDGGNSYPITIAAAVPNNGNHEITVPNNVGTKNRIMVKGTDHIFYDISNTNFEITKGDTNGDSEAPTAPTNLTASAITQTTVDLTWNAATDNVAVTAYQVYNGSTLIETVTTTAYQVTGLTPETTYDFSVKAVDAAGNASNASNIETITTLASADTEAPTAPSNLTASAITQTTVDLTWNAATDNLAVTAYQVYNGSTLIETVTTTAYQVTGLTPETTYDFTVTAIDAAGNVSNASNMVTITTLAPLDTEAPTAPTNLTASAITQTTVDLAWDSATDNVAVTAYQVYNGTTLIQTVTTTAYQVTGLTPETTYNFSVTAIDAAGNISSSSNVVTVTTVAEIQCIGGSSELSYTESFENTLGAWIQSSDDAIDWTLHTDATPSTGTGPSSASDGDYYIYIEASRPNHPNKTGILTSPCYDLSQAKSASFVFDYHMYGNSTTVRLAVEVSTDEGTTWTSLWEMTGNQGNQWKTQRINLNNYLGSKILVRFNGTTGTTWKGDIAIDHIRLTASETSCQIVEFTLNFDNYPQETSWKIMNDTTGKIVIEGGEYSNEYIAKTIVIQECLSSGSYTLIINDSFGDGLCCAWGTGSYSLMDANGAPLGFGATFGSEETISFTIDFTNKMFVNETTTTTPEKIVVHPNPVGNNEALQVVIPKDTQDTIYKIYNTLGSEVKSGELTQKAIQTSDLPKGMYILQLFMGDYGKLETIPFIKK